VNQEWTKIYLDKDSEIKLDAIANYLSSLIESKEKKKSDYVKIHETEKNNYSLISTSRRCKILQEALPVAETIVSLKLGENKKFDFKVSKSRFEFEKQSSSNNAITEDQISNLCTNITGIKLSMKDLILSVYNKFVSNFEQYQTELETIINFVTMIDVLYNKLLHMVKTMG
jgi:hypothetical protein